MGPTELAVAGSLTALSSRVSSTRPTVSIMPTSSEPTSAPRIEPMPPITITSKAGMRMLSPMPTLTASSGPSNAPASAQARAERAKTKVNRGWMRTP